MNEINKMSPSVLGIHHVTAIAGDPQKNYEFYTKLLGLRFIKKTVNFDDPYTYHFYFGNESGDPGTILTFFPWTDTAYKGKRGSGQITTISFSISKDSISYWIERLKEYHIQFTGPFKRFEDEVILFEDHDGFELELSATNEKLIDGWDNGDIPSEHSIRGFNGVTLTVDGFLKTEDLLINLLGFNKFLEAENRYRYKTKGSTTGMFVDILNLPGSIPGRMGVGTIHHVAFRTENDENQLKLRNRLVENNFNVTPVIDRTYFHSIYFREPANILFEIATDPPGFLIDEDISSLGKHLKLPSWYEQKRSDIEKSLPRLKTV